MQTELINLQSEVQLAKTTFFFSENQNVFSDATVFVCSEYAFCLPRNPICVS